MIERLFAAGVRIDHLSNSNNGTSISRFATRVSEMDRSWRAANEAARTMPGDVSLTATIEHTILSL